MTETGAYDWQKDPLHNCILKQSTSYVPNEAEMAHLRLLGLEFDAFDVTSWDIAYVMGRHFKAGEWKKYPFCGSVITCVVDGRSLYARVNRFLTIKGDRSRGYASVSWFDVPEYPLGNPLVVRVREDGRCLDDRYGPIVRITQIDPSQVMVEPASDGETHFMMRDAGYDNVR